MPMISRGAAIPEKPKREHPIYPVTPWVSANILKCSGWCHFSVSQGKSVVECAGRLHAARVAGLKDGDTPATIFGKNAHKAVEDYLLRGVEPVSEIVKGLITKPWFEQPAGLFLDIDEEAECQIVFGHEGWYIFSMGKPIGYTRLHPNLAGSEIVRGGNPSKSWVPFHPIRHPNPWNSNFLLEWHISHELTHIFGFPCEGYIDYWEPSKDGSKPDIILDHKFLKDEDKFESLAQLRNNSQLLVYGLYVFEYFDRKQKSIILGQNQVSKANGYCNRAVFEMPKEELYKKVEKVIPVVDFIRHVRTLEFKDVPVNAPTGVGNSSACFAYGKKCPAFDVCTSIPEKRVLFGDVKEKFGIY